MLFKLPVLNLPTGDVCLEESLIIKAYSSLHSKIKFVLSFSEVAAANASKLILANCVLYLDYILDLYEVTLGYIEKIKYFYQFLYYSSGDL